MTARIYARLVRYLFAVMADHTVDSSANQEEGLAINRFNEKIESSGHQILAVGVAAPDTAKVFDNRNGRSLVITGQAIDSDLYMAGFWIIDAESDEVACDLASEASKACNRLIEVRPLL
jgi:hypothetical protein